MTWSNKTLLKAKAAEKMKNQFLYDIPKEKITDKTRTKSVTQRTSPANPGNNSYSFVANIGPIFLKRRISGITLNTT